MTHLSAQAILFDVGGTLISEDPCDSILPFLDRLGARYNRNRWLEAIQKADAYHSAHQDHAKNWEQALGVWREFDRIMLETLEVENAQTHLETLVNAWNDPSVWPVFPGARDTIAELCARGHRLGVISNWDGGLEQVLEVVGLRQHFEFVIASATFGTRKPDPRIFHAALERLGLPAQDVVYVGNNLKHDAHAARGVGMHAVLIPSFGQELRDGADLERITVLDNLNQLLEHFPARQPA